MRERPTFRCHYCGREGVSSYHFTVCPERPFDRFCDCVTCEGHREGKERARECDREASADLALFSVCGMPSIEVVARAGRSMQTVRR